MGSNLRIIDKLRQKDNDYSFLEPFENMKPISSSIVIPVYNYAELFYKSLCNLSKNPQLVKNPDLFEIIIVDDFSDENISEIVRSIKVPCKIDYLRLTKNEGRSKARNIGIRKSSAEIVFLLDCDMFVPKNYFEEHWKIHNAGSKSVVVGLAENLDLKDPRINDLSKGDDLKPNIKKDFRYYKDVSKFASTDQIKEYRLINETNWFKTFGSGREIGIWTLPFMVVGHNMSFNRSEALAVNGFDERFVGWGCEDTYFGAKLIARGNYVIPIRTTGAFRVKHPPRRGDDGSRRSEMLENLQRYENLILEELINV